MFAVRRLMDEAIKRWPWTPATKTMLLGVAYECADEAQRARMLEDFASRIQLTYRSGLSTPLRLADGKELRSDAGWGCALRVMQMMLAQCFVSLLLGREWRYSPERDLLEGSAYRDIIACFLDVPSAPFGLHKFVEAGCRLLGKAPSAWFGPTSAARVVGHLFEAQARDAQSEAPAFLAKVSCVPFEDGVIFKSVVLECFRHGAASVIFFVCLRLGLEEFNLSEYRAGLEACFSLPEFQGLASGNSTTSAHFFVGTSDDRLLFLDPHITFPALESTAGVDCGLHPQRPLPLRWASLNPSVCMGFLVRSPAELEVLCGKLSSGHLGAVFEVLDVRPAYAERGQAAVEEDEDMVLLQ